MDLRKAVRDLAEFEDATSLAYPWAKRPDELLNEDVLSRIGAAVSPAPDGTYDTDELYDAIDAVAGMVPARTQKGTEKL